jgi:small subunit ribosomal protein S6
MKTVEKKEARSYELVVVLGGDATSAKKKAFETSLEKLVGILEGKIVNVLDWGKKELAYAISGNSSGVFLIFDLELLPERVRALEDKMRLDEQVIRHLVISKEK